MQSNPEYVGGAFKMTSNWNNEAKHLKRLYTTLTDSDLFFKAGMEKELLRRIENKLKKRREEVIELIKLAQLHAQIN